MNTEYINNNRMLIALCGLSLLFSSCIYEEVKDAEYPDQTLYMPAAYSTVYDVSAVQNLNPEHPSSGSPFRFQIEEESSEFIVPLGIYRAGINKEGAFSVKITTDEAVVTRLMDQGSFDSHRGDTEVAILPSNEYSIPAELNIQSGEGHGTFFLTVNLEFLRANQSTSYALAIGLSSDGREVNPDLNTAVVFIPAGIAE